MEAAYDILLAGEPVGQARVTRQGLYYHFDCRCKLSGETMCRLVACCGEKSESLGIPVPEGAEFTLTTKVAVSRLGMGDITIRAVPKHAPVGETFIPVSPEEPFRYLSRLKNAFLSKRDGKPGIVIRETSQ